MENEKLEFGRYTDDELFALADGDVHGGGTPIVVASAISAYVSYGTCPTTSCTESC